MTRRLHRGAAAVLVAVLGLLIPGVLPGVAMGQTQQPPPRPNALARLELSDLSPRVVTVTSVPVLRLTGRVVNIGDHPISQLQIRFQRDEAVNSDEAVTRAIQGDSEAPHVTRFQPVPGDLAPGRSSSFQLDVPLRGGPDLDSLQITTPGVYPLLINLNGKPDLGGMTRLASVPLLLPVLGIPPASPGSAAVTARSSAVSVAPASPSELHTRVRSFVF